MRPGRAWVDGAGRRATVDDVAHRAGVSRQTVSRVINHSGPVSAATRSRVESVVVALAYVPDLSARQMGRARRARGAVAPPVDLPAGCAEAIEVLRRAGLAVEVYGSDVVAVVPTMGAERLAADR